MKKKNKRTKKKRKIKEKRKRIWKKKKIIKKQKKKSAQDTLRCKLGLPPKRALNSCRKLFFFSKIKYYQVTISGMCTNTFVS